MGSSPCINISLLLIIASMAMVASSSTPIQPEITYDFPTCLESIKGCFFQIYQFKLALLTGGQPDAGLICPACCQAIVDIHEKCWVFLFPDPFFTPALQNYCTRSQTAPSPANPDTPLAPSDPPPTPVDPPAPAPDVDPPAPAPDVDPPAPAPQAPSPAPDVDPPAPAPQAPSPAPDVDPPAPAPQPPSPAPQVDPPPPAQSPVDPPAPAPRRRCHRHRHHGGGGGGGLDEKWFCT